MKAYITEQGDTGELYHPSSQKRFALFALYDDIIMHKIALL
jgi:hypothetical protein